MSCYRCAAAFGFLSRSYGCKKCGHLYCSKCAHQYAVVPGRGSEKQRVCISCYDQLKRGNAELSTPQTKVSSHSSPQPLRSSVGQPGVHSNAFSHLPPSQRKAAQNRAALARCTGPPPEEEHLRWEKPPPYSYENSGSSPRPPRYENARPSPAQQSFAHLPPSQRLAAQNRAAQAERTYRSPEDLQIEQRLRNLRSDSGPKKGEHGGGGGGAVNSEQGEDDIARHDIEGRLARLIGVSKGVLTGEEKPIHQPDQRKKTAVEEADDIFKQAEEEARVEAAVAAGDAQLQARLDGLRENPSTGLTAATGGFKPQGKAEEDQPAGNKADCTTSGDALGNEALALLQNLTAECQREEQQARDLLKAEADLVARAARLSGKPEDGAVKQWMGGGNHLSSLDAEMMESDDDDDAGVQKLLKGLEEEAALDRRLEAAGLSDVVGSTHPTKGEDKGVKQLVQDEPAKPSGLVSEKDQFVKEDELPWCCICNSDAVMRCLDCDSDLYCRRCFREGHDRFMLADHRTVPFRKTQGHH